ncbi:MAG: NCS2 family permease, partial [Chitinophagales bacterium]
TSYIESATGIAEGGRSGLTSATTGILFLVALFFIPIISVVPAYATAPALILVGIFMIQQIVRIDFNNLEDAVPAILTLIMMPLTFSISTGMAIGFISWGLIRVLQFKFKEVSWIMWMIIGLSVLNFAG